MHKQDLLFILIVLVWLISAMLCYEGMVSLWVEEILCVLVWLTYAGVNCWKYFGLPRWKRPEGMIPQMGIAFSFVLVLAALLKAYLLLIFE